MRELPGRFVAAESAERGRMRYRECTQAVKQYLEDVKSEPTNYTYCLYVRVL